MAITQAMCTSFKAEVLLGVHDFRPDASATSDVFKLALYSAAATLSAGTTSFTTSSESTGTTSGGSALVNLGVTIGDSTGFVDFSDLTFTNVTINAAGCLIYNSSQSNKAVCALDFGGNKSSSSGTFTIQFPTAASSTAIIRIS